MADVEKAWKHFDLYEAECKAVLAKYAELAKDNDGVESDGRAPDKSRFPLLAAYDLCLKCSHLFNILDARGAISVTERVGVIGRVRALAVGIAKAWVDQQKSESASAEKLDEPESVPAKKEKNQHDKLSAATI
jgi:glycyl-tRNA synthetase alpha chain